MDLAILRLVCTGAIVVAALLFIALECRFPYQAGLKVLREGFWTDLIWYTLVQSYVLGLVIAEVIRWLDAATAGRPQVVTDWPLWGQVVFFLVVHDLYIYWMHRWQHHNPVLWRTHEAHHSPREVDWLSGVRSHSVEILINGVVEFAPIVLLGAAPEVAIIKGAISAVWGMFIHSNLDVRLGPLRYVINGPQMHRWHHADHPDVYFANYATKLSIWDWIFGTAYLPDRRKPPVYGLPYRFPANYFRQHAAMFRPLSRKDAGGGMAIGERRERRLPWAGSS